jgi:hypothetical protein
MVKPWAWTLADALRAKLKSGEAFSLNVWFVGQRLTDEPARLSLVSIGDGAMEVRRLGELWTDEPIFINLASVAAIEVED